MSLSLDQDVILLQLAAAAMQVGTKDPVLPDGWSLLCTLQPDGSQSPPCPKSFGFYAIGSLTTGGPTVAVLALGLSWAAFFGEYISETLDMSTMRGFLPAAPTAAFESQMQPVYLQMRAGIWGNLSRISGKPLYITGMAAGGPLAQLATLDLRPGNSGPNKIQAPAQSSACRTFSTPICGNTDLATYYQTKVPDSTAMVVGSAANPIDFFPLRPADGEEGASLIYAHCGTIQTVNATRPTPYDDPWVERSAPFYQAALGGEPSPPPSSPGNVVDPPAGFSQDMALSLAFLCAATYQFRQHPAAVLPFPTAPFVYDSDITINGVVLASVFTCERSVAVAFRGPVTWQETLSSTTNLYRGIADFLASDDASVHQGALLLYTAPVVTGQPQTVREALAAKLRTLASANKPVYLTGHDLGGVLAILAAADLAVNQTALPVAGVYTFGAPPAGSFVFAYSVYNGLPAANGRPLGQVSYHLYRPTDFMPKLWKPYGYEQVDNPVRLNGIPENDDPGTAHALTGYIDLLTI